MPNKIEKAVAKAAALAPEAMKAILLKVRKGADATVSIGQVLHIINLVGGSWELEAGLVPMKGVDTRSGEPWPVEIYAPGKGVDDSWIIQRHRDYKAKEIYEIPRHITPGETYITNVSKIGLNAHDWAAFTYVEWSGVYGIRVTMLDGQSELALPSYYDLRAASEIDAFVNITSTKPFERGLLDNLKRWLSKETDYKARVCQLLDMEEHVPAAQRTRDNTGCCPVCFREIKLERGRMVAHGFRRPRYAGYTVGNCFGVFRPAYELSNEGVIDYLSLALLPEMAGLKNTLASVEGDLLDEYPHGRQGKMIRRGQERDYTKSIPSFEEARESFYKELKREIEHMTYTIALYQTLVAEWKPRELPTEGGPPRAWLREIVNKIK